MNILRTLAILEPVMLIPQSSETHNEYLSGNYISECVMSPATEDNILEIINKLKDSAPEWDKISPCTLKHVKSLVVMTIAFLFNIYL